MFKLDFTHDANTHSFVDTANGHENFPLQNLPLGIFSNATTKPQGGVAIGDYIFDIKAAVKAKLFTGAALKGAKAASQANLNAFFALPVKTRLAFRHQMFKLLEEGSPAQENIILHKMSEATLHLPAHIGDYTDFYAGINHAMNVGKLFRPDSPLMPNYKHLPVGYHGRASSVVVSGTPIRRPKGQILKAETQLPSYEPCKRLDYELELGLFIGQGNALGETIGIGEAHKHIAGYCLLNDWSARDIQAFEYQPLGPFLAKNFGTTLSPWVISGEALAPFFQAQAKRGKDDPQLLDYLTDKKDQKQGALNIILEILLHTPRMKAEGEPPARTALTNSENLYYTPAQMVAHHANGGCNLQSGDLMGSGTISGKDSTSCGALLESTSGGKNVVTFKNGETRTFLLDGDEVIFKGFCTREGFATIGFGEARGVILPAVK